MNLSRSHRATELLNILWSSKQTCLYCIKVIPCLGFRKRYSSSFRMASVDQAELDRVRNHWKKILGKVEYRDNAIFVLGPMCAGKTTIIEQKFKTHSDFKHYAYVDTDEIMGSINGFTAKNVEQYYPMARQIAIELTDWILTRNISFVAEGTCVKVDELTDYMIRLKRSKYNIQVYRLPLISLEEILQRSKNKKNRIIADDVVTSIYNNAKKGLKELYTYNTSKGVQCRLFKDVDFTEAIKQSCLT